MNVLNTCAAIPSVFDGGHFRLKKWERYMDAHLPRAKESCLADMRECVAAGYSWEKNFLPVLDAVAKSPERCEKVVSAFQTVTKDLDERIKDVFGKTVDADIVLYLGLCNGAGWATEIGGVPTVLLGIEKILELGWDTVADMTGLILHELGHLYQAQYGAWEVPTETPEEAFLWQLFTEGVAMVFEQELVGDEDFFHQDKNGWKAWCDSHFEQIKRSFSRDLPTMTKETQRYFGDWVDYEGHGDTGYYLGARFVRYLLRSDPFDRVIRYGIGEVKEKYRAFGK